jgi:hypothetical protein
MTASCSDVTRSLNPLRSRSRLPMLAMRVGECRAGEENTMTTWNRDGAGALVFWIVSVTSGLCARTAGLWRRCGGAVVAWMAIWAVGCGKIGNADVQGQDASQDVLRGDQESVALDSSPSDAAGNATSDSAASDAITAACAAFANVYCSKYSSCDGTDFGEFFGSLGICEQRFEQFCPDQYSAPGTTASPSDVEACAEATSDLTCGQFLTSVQVQTFIFPPACQMPAGSESTGAPCEYNAQCSSGFCSVVSGFCGTCQIRVSIGQMCDSMVGCANGLICANTSCPIDGGPCAGALRPICFKPRGEGGECDTEPDCEPPLACVGRACTSVLPEGSPCDGGGCGFTQALVCRAKEDGGPQTCVQATFAPAGAECNYTTTPPTFCGAFGSCQSVTGADANVGTCAAAAADGQSCVNALCLYPALCISGTCQAPPPASSCK